MTVHCPNCDSTEIREKNVAYAQLRVTKWEFNGDDGLSPAEWDFDVDTDWETDDGESSPYICAMCDWEGNLHNLVVRGR
jgi:hypothetical protein